MQIVHNLQEWQTIRKTLPHTLGFVPTMGNLHQGHLSLYHRSIQENDCTVASLFINPRQFNNPNDFLLYPRTLEEDLAMLEANGVDYCLLPNETSIYPDEYTLQIHETKLSQRMEGAHRPGHFDGVLTIVMKLFQLVKPQKAYFGEKDYQQYQLISAMVNAFFMDIQIIPCPTVREGDHLACSSRNNRLTPEQRLLAGTFAGIFHQTKPINLIKQELEDLGIPVEYLEEHENRRFIAVRIGEIRLIDNYSIQG